MKAGLALLTAHLASAQIADPSACAAILREYSNGFMANSDRVLHIFRNSGKDYNDYGRF